MIEPDFKWIYDNDPIETFKQEGTGDLVFFFDTEDGILRVHTGMGEIKDYKIVNKVPDKMRLFERVER